MVSHLKSSVIRMPFDVVADQLKSELFKQGFEINAVIDPGSALAGAAGCPPRKYKIFVVCSPILYQEMLLTSSSEGAILPCVISAVETYPGMTALILHNSMELLAKNEGGSFRNLADEITKRLEFAIRSLQETQSSQPDLVTSWS